VNLNDTIRPYGHALYLQFASTGESRSASTLQLDQGITVSKDGASVVGRYHLGDSSFVIENFSSENLAANALSMIQASMQRFAKRQRWTTTVKGAVRWGLAPVIAAMFALALNAAATRSLVSNAPATPYGANGPLPAPMSLPAPVAAAPVPTEAAQPPVAEVAKGMGDAIKDGRLSVQLSTGPKGTLYVFSDPSCPHCQDFERELDTLGKSYTVQVLPVDVVGHALSTSRIGQMLCMPAADRAAAWKKLIAGAGLSGSKQCADGAAAGVANDRIFAALGLSGTPTVVAADGRIMPYSTPLKAACVDAWMQSASR